MGWHRHLKVILSASWVLTFVTITVMQECTIGLQGLFSGLICPCTYPSLSKVFLLTKSVLSLWGRTLAASGLQLAPSLSTIKLSCGFPADGRLVLLSLCMAGPVLTQFPPPQSVSFHSVVLLMMPVCLKQRHFLLLKLRSKYFLSRFLLLTHCAKIFYITGLLVCRLSHNIKEPLF